MLKRLFIVFFFVLCAPLSAEEILLDAIVASIDDNPITLSDVAKHLSPPRKVTLAEASDNAEFGRALDIVILNRLVEIEAQQRKISVFDEEINEYLKEIAKRNNLTEEQFLEALKRENHSLADYREQIKSDILRSKLASSLSRGASAVSDAEVDKAIKEQQGTPKAGRMVTLRQILITTQLQDEEHAEKLIDEIKEKLNEGEKFDDLARIYSDSPEKEDGGLLGTLAESDLHSEVLDAIHSLDVGEVSEVVKTDQGYHLFLLEERNDPEEEADSDDLAISEDEREHMRNALKQQKMESKMTEFFTSELYKLHSVDKKI